MSEPIHWVPPTVSTIRMAPAAVTKERVPSEGRVLDSSFAALLANPTGNPSGLVTEKKASIEPADSNRPYLEALIRNTPRTAEDSWTIVAPTVAKSGNRQHTEEGSQFQIYSKAADGNRISPK